MWFATASSVVICTTRLGLTELQVSISKSYSTTCMVGNRKEKTYSSSDTHLQHILLLSQCRFASLNYHCKSYSCFLNCACLSASGTQLAHLHPLAVTGKTQYLYLTYVHFQLQIYWGSLYQCIHKIIQKEPKYTI